LRNLYKGTSNLRFGPDIKDNPFQQLSGSRVPILPTFPTWESTDDVYYYNLFKNKGPAKRKVTFGQTITTLPSNLLSGKPPRYQTRYQTRSNNSSEKLPDDNDDDDDDDNDDNNPLQIVNLINPHFHHLPHLHVKIWMTETKEKIILLIEAKII